jgi:hypothetical protein
MPDQYRRLISELITRYEFEPQLRDLYVEGDRDLYLFRWFFSRRHCAKAVVYSVGVVDVPADLLSRHNVAGNKGRVIALCRELAANLPEEVRSIRGLVDKDDFHLLGISLSSRYLVTTDYSCLECYALDESSLEKFFGLYLGKMLDTNTISKILGVLAEVFMLRTAKTILSNESGWIHEFTRCCSLSSGGIIFDRREFVRRLSNVSAGRLQPAALESKFMELQQAAVTDLRQIINGHDLIRMVSWFAHNIGVDGAIANERAIHRGLMVSIELEQLNTMPLFQALVNWATS